MSKYTPTDQQVEDSFAYDPEYEYHHPDDPGYHYRNRAAYKRWLSEHDRLVAERAWEEGARWAAVEFGKDASLDESQVGLVPSDNPYRKEQENNNA